MRFGSLTNKMMGEAKQGVPVIGEGCTIIHWTDRTAATVIEITRGGKSVAVQLDMAVRTDDLSDPDSQKYHLERSPENPVLHWTLRKDGRYYQRHDKKRDGYGILFGRRDHFYDLRF